METELSAEMKLPMKSEPVESEPDFRWVNNPSELHHLIEEARKKFQPMPQGLTASDIMAGRAQGVMSVEEVLEYYRCNSLKITAVAVSCNEETKLCEEVTLYPIPQYHRPVPVQPIVRDFLRERAPMSEAAVFAPVDVEQDLAAFHRMFGPAGSDGNSA
jgi:hypothetical protein